MSIVNTDFNSLFGAIQMNRLERAITQTTQRISSGSKLNNSGDNPSGVLLAGNFQKHLGGIMQATQNAENAISLLNTADSTFSNINEKLLRMEEISLAAMNDATLTPADFITLNDEYQGLLTSVTDTAANATFNSVNILDGTYAAPGLSAQIGPFETGGTQAVIIADAVTGLAGLAGTDVLSAGNATTALGQVNTAIDFTSASQGQIGGEENLLNQAVNALGTDEINIASALSNITDADMASEIATFSKLQILTEATTAVMAQTSNLKTRIIDLLDKMD